MENLLKRFMIAVSVCVLTAFGGESDNSDNFIDIGSVTNAAGWGSLLRLFQVYAYRIFLQYTAGNLVCETFEVASMVVSGDQ